MSQTTPETPKSTRMLVSLQVGGFFFALANVICVAILAWTYVHVKLEPKSIEVKGSAKKAISSDLITWSAVLTTRDPDLPKAYDKLKADADRTTAFLLAAGIPEKDITLSSINTQKIYQREVIPNPGNTPALSTDPAAPPTSTGTNAKTVIVTTQKIEMYILTQTVNIESADMKRVPEVARNVTSLIKNDVEIDSGTPSYRYTKLSELKIDMLAEATKDATTRATQIVSNANGKLGRLVEAKMGVMQINPKGSTSTSAEGNNDTTSLEKEITAIVTARYELQ